MGLKLNFLVDEHFNVTYCILPFSIDLGPLGVEIVLFFLLIALIHLNVFGQDDIKR